MKESYEKAYEEYKNMKEGTFDFKKYIDNQRGNKEENKMEKSKIIIFIILGLLLLVRVLFELNVMSEKISNETMVFTIIIALMFFFLNE